MTPRQAPRRAGTVPEGCQRTTAAADRPWLSDPLPSPAGGRGQRPWRWGPAGVAWGSQAGPSPAPRACCLHASLHSSCFHGICCISKSSTGKIRPPSAAAPQASLCTLVCLRRAEEHQSQCRASSVPAHPCARTHTLRHTRTWGALGAGALSAAVARCPLQGAATGTGSASD